MSHQSDTCDKSILSHEITFYLSNSFVKTKNEDLNFYKCIKDYNLISHEFSQDVYKEFNNVRDFLFLYNVNKYVIKQTSLKIQEKSQISSLYVYILP